jgi:hypothetical protein
MTRVSYDYHLNESIGVAIAAADIFGMKMENARSSTKYLFCSKGFGKPALTVIGGHRKRSLTGIPKSTKKITHPKRPVLPFLGREQSGPTSRSVLMFGHWKSIK